MVGRSFLAPEDAIYLGHQPSQSSSSLKARNEICMPLHTSGEKTQSRRERQKHRNRSGSRRQKSTWKKLLWVKQSYPDNYTDQETFLEHLQRNPRLQPYEFWPLVADSTVIVQHVCSVIIFIVCFISIFQEHISPISVVGWGSIATFLGWVLWDSWVGCQDLTPKPIAPPTSTHSASAPSSIVNLPNTLARGHSYSPPSSSVVYDAIRPSGILPRHSYSVSTSSISLATSAATRVSSIPIQPQTNHFYQNKVSHRTSMRLGTIKSALLIYFALLGLSPILKSLTRSTSSDSIWAMSFALFTINIFFFDYGTLAPSTSGSAIKQNNIPASLSTNAALMASTVLASRLPSTGQVFSLTLFSIEVFGLFPVFRRYLRQRSWRGHVVLTTFLVLGAGGGVGLILGRGGDGEGFWDFPYKSGCIGLVIGVFLTTVAMGGCSWWLIGLQKYKNAIRGPWDPARPVIRRAWEDEF
ncbi:BgTH12-06191 [Blumeria graminis f. sp. triticale]|uniref:Bgt-2376 n=3 Tax=Blumeria graminis TaxID=34373 RepID=A0A061HPK0_BLUGR|nr:hypothetical protein BGT96224_2376 [Blumeria graminis f. sp. tritici 96224]CAD6504462.1 BgTH12-06191 [Blumeria graminis f. sp. triticale]VDB91359.1 Bgt-2376 [Blumeria graminis f. sp. tritici]